MLTAYSRRDVALWFTFGLLGLVAGAALAVVMLGQEVDRVTLDNALLMDQMEYLSNRILLLDTRGPSAGPYVEAIEVVAEGVERARPAVEQTLKGMLSHLIGEELERVNAATIQQALERTLVVERQEYSIQVLYIYVTPTVRVYVRARSGGSTNLSD